MIYTLQFKPVLDRFDILLGGASLTLYLSAISICIGLVIGFFCAASRIYGNKIMRYLCGLYVEVIRNTPFLIQIFIIYFGLPVLGFRISADQSAVVALSINAGAYLSEIIRAGLSATPKSQIEAGYSLSLTGFQVFRHVVFIPALERVYPALVGQFTLILLGSALVASVSATELTAAASFVESETFRSFETYLVVTILYIFLAFLVRWAFGLLGYVIFRRRRVVGWGGSGA